MKKKLVFVVNVDWFFESHRLPIALAAINVGYEVHLLCAATNRKKYLENVGIIVHDIRLSRSGINIFKEFIIFSKMFRILSAIKPDVIHCVTIKPVIYGNIIGRLIKTPSRISSISGLGYVFISKGFKSFVIRKLVSSVYKISLKGSSRVIFQNKDDRDVLRGIKAVSSEQEVFIRGSGVCLDKFKFSPEPDSTSNRKVVMFLARLLKDKGVSEFCEAASLLHNKSDARFVLVGDIDPDNPNSLSKAELLRLVKEGVVEHWGYTKKVEDVIPMSHIMVLPSYREGLPKSLIEAAACGRAVITTDVPGCRDAIEPEITGLLVASKNSKELASCISYLLANDERRRNLGRAGRDLAERCFDINNVVDTHLQIYEGNA
ncbi:TPA: glycosyltransferase family 1 protein [Vibrio vulnificus]|nr:glycosyltransferase family 1 protein [Vibrio vulnificus]